MRKLRIKAFLREARRRRIHTSAAAYVAVSVVSIEVGNAIFNALIPESTLAPRLLTIALLLAFPVVLVLAWIFDFTLAGGITRTAALGEGQAPSQGWSGSYVPTKPTVQPKTIEIVESAPQPERVRRASLSFVRHELRTPINAIIGYSEMLLDDARDEKDDVAAADLERIVHCGRDILLLVDGILGEDRISAEQGRDLASYGEQIRADLRDPLGAVTGYTEMLIEISREEENHTRAKDLEKVLSAARKLLELSNDIATLATKASEINVSDLAKAATLAENVLSKIRAVETEPSIDREGSLLVVDDNVMNRELLSKQLARKGDVVTSAESGVQALEALREQHFDLVLLDVLMDGMDGIEVLRRLKGDADLCTIPVIMISALDEIDSVVRCLEIGAADFVSKPFHPTLLDARIQATLNAHAAQSAPAMSYGPIDRLVEGTFPSYVTRRIRMGETRILDAVPNAAVYFVDLDQAVAATDPRERAARVEMLIEAAHTAAHQNEATVLLHGIGLLMAAGFPHSVADAPERMARTALTFAREAEQRGLKCRSALHTGALYGAVVGTNNLAYSVWGDAVDLARRMALSAERGEIVVSTTCATALKDGFALKNRGVMDVAGRGQMKAFVLGGETVVA